MNGMAAGSTRVVMIVPEFPKLSETFIVSKFLGLIDRGFDVLILCDRSDPAEWDRFPELTARPGLRRRVVRNWPSRPFWLAALCWPLAIVRCASKNPRGLGRYLARGWGRLGRHAAKRVYLDAGLIAARPALVHFEFGTLAVGRTWIKGPLECKVVVSFRGFDLNMAGLDDPAYYAGVWSEADALHLLGEGLWGRAQSRGCPPDVRRVLIPPAVDVGYFEPPADDPDRVGPVGTPDRPLRVLSVGRLHWNKGYDDALMAIRRLADLGVRCEYRIVGDGEYFEAVAFARHQLGLSDRVILLGSQPRAEVRRQLSWSDLVLHAAVSEGFCNAVVEAQAMGRPVVCTDAQGLPENVEHGVTGFVVPRRDPTALACRLSELARDPDLRLRMGEAGRLRVLGRFDVADQVEAFATLYRKVLGRPVSTHDA